MLHDNMKAARVKLGIKKAEVARRLAIPYTTYNGYETGNRSPSPDQLPAIANVLNVDVNFLLHGKPLQDRSPFWSSDLEEKLRHIGYSIGSFEEDAMIWINYPDGTLEVSDIELQLLNDGADAFLRFQLQELKARKKEDFQPHAKQAKE